MYKKTRVCICKYLSNVGDSVGGLVGILGCAKCVKMLKLQDTQ